MERAELCGLKSLKRDLDLFDPGVHNRGTEEPPRESLPLFYTDSEIVWGFSHINYLEERKSTEEVWAVHLEENDPVKLLALALSLENRRDRYSLREKVNFYRFLQDRSCTERVDEVSPLVSGKGSFAAQAVLYLELPGAARKLAEENSIDLKTASRVSDLSEETLSLFSRFVNSESGQRFSFSQRRLLLNNLWEVVKREELSGKEPERLFTEILGAKDPLRAAAVRRYPELTVREEAFRAFEKEHCRGTGIILEPPSCFEGDSYGISFSVNSPKQLDRMIARLSVLRNKADELFRLL